MTTRDQNIQKIRDACIAAHPSKFWAVGLTPKDDCRLADVLLAIETKQYPYLHLVSEAGYFYREIPNGIEMIRGRSWNLRHDDLTLQSDELLAFVAEIV